ncbi:hypothetical protein BGZ67_010650, partial [Mortierella alpina]
MKHATVFALACIAGVSAAGSTLGLLKEYGESPVFNAFMKDLAPTFEPLGVEVPKYDPSTSSVTFAASGCIATIPILYNVLGLEALN